MQATALQMAWVAATIAGRGKRPRLTLERGLPEQRTQVVDAGVARMVGRFMEAVVQRGHRRRRRRSPNVRVAGKTGTAELRDTSTPDCMPSPDPAVAPCPPVEPNDPTDTDAWFAAYAPAGEPRVAVGVLLVEAGAGGDTAAPVAKQVLVAGSRPRASRRA